MSRRKSQHLGAGVVTRYRNGACTFTCRHDGCRAYSEPPSWRAALRQARHHDAEHNTTEATYAGTPWGIPTHELPPTGYRRRGRARRRVLAVALVLALALFAAVIANGYASADRIGSTGSTGSTTVPAVPSLVVTPDSNTIGNTTGNTTSNITSNTGYVPTPAGAPTDTTRAAEGVSR
jgi:hypothetical protein